MFKRLASGLALLPMIAPPAIACAFHLYAPQDTLVDKMLASEHIVLAQIDENDTSRYQAISAFKGGVDYVELPFAADTDIRLQLSLHPDHRVLFAREEAYGPWRQLAYLDAEFLSVVHHVSQQMDAWMFEDERLRYAYFAGLHDHANDDIRRLALAELDKAPYEVLRALPMSVSTERMAQNFWDIDEADYRAIKTLMLGMSDDAEAGQFLLTRYSDALALGDPLRLGAAATAYVEHAGLLGVSKVLSTLAETPDMDPDSAEILIEAMAIHDQVGDPVLKMAIETALADLLLDRPDLAGAAARQFGSRGGWGLAAPLERLMQDRRLLDLSDVLAVGQYVALAREAQSSFLRGAPDAGGNEDT